MFAIGIDSGTQATKALVVDFETGRVLGRGRAPHEMVPGLPPGASEQEPETWVRAMEEALAGALRESRVDPKKVVCLGVSGQQHGFVPLDRRGLPLRPAKLWNDTSTIAETDDLVRRLGGKAKYIERLGISLAVGFTASKILWLKNHEAAKFGRLATVLLPHNYLNFHLTGRTHMEYGDASGTGLMDIRKLRWSGPAVRAVDPALAGNLPRLCHPREPVGVVRKDVASRFGLGRVLVSSGGGDNMMGAIGTGNVAPGICTLSLGTSGTVYSFCETPLVDPDGEIAAFCDSTGGWLPLLCTMNVTNVTEILKSVLRVNNERLEALAGKAAPGSDGLLFLPFVDGERVPVLPFSSAVLFGLDRRTFTPAHLARSVIEGTILNLGYGIERMRTLGLRPGEIRATGGGARSRLWLQTAADVFGVPVVTLREQEAAAYGGALQSIWSYLLEKGERVPIREVVRKRVVLDKLAAEPREANRGIYAESRKRFDALWRSLLREFQARRQAAERR